MWCCCCQRECKLLLVLLLVLLEGAYTIFLLTNKVGFKPLPSFFFFFSLSFSPSHRDRRRRSSRMVLKLLSEKKQKQKFWWWCFVTLPPITAEQLGCYDMRCSATALQRCCDASCNVATSRVSTALPHVASCNTTRIVL